MTEIREDHVLDARGLLCPMPVVKAAKAMKELDPGQVLKILATDRGSIADMPAWAEDTGNELLEWHEDGDDLVYLVRKGDDA
ncbi:MAG TPA: sulfurtransferase TusA family protein [Gaiellaceae bacterium]|nr:sulfurtransferase TusA family protein [Gaiellaceae bacterium]